MWPRIELPRMNLLMQQTERRGSRFAPAVPNFA